MDLQPAPNRLGAAMLPHSLNGVSYFPIPLTNFQFETNEILIKLHKNHLYDQYQIKEANRSSEKKEDSLSDSELINLLYSNINLATNNPYLLVNHYIPKNMLLMNTKDSLTNVSHKFHFLNQIIQIYEKQNNISFQKYDVLLLANNSKEIDFVESLLIGRFVNYKRYSGSKLYDSKSKRKAAPFSSRKSSLLQGKRFAASSKDDQYLVTRLRRKHKKIMKYVNNNSYNANYCLTIHLITINQLKFQFFTSSNPGITFDFLQLKNTTPFNYIISFNNYVNLDHYFLKELRSGHIDAATNIFVNYSKPLPILNPIALGSIEHVTMVVHDWLIAHQVIGEESSDFATQLDERPTKINLNCRDNSIILLILRIYFLARRSYATQKKYEDESFLRNWALGNTSQVDFELSSLVFPGDFNGYLNFFKSNFNSETLSLNPNFGDNDPLKDETEIAINQMFLKYHDFNVDPDLMRIPKLLEKNKKIFDKFPEVIKEFAPNSLVNLLAEKQIGDATEFTIEGGQPRKRLKTDDLSSSSLLTFDSAVPEQTLKSLEVIAEKYASFQNDESANYEPLNSFPLNFKDYNSKLNSFFMIRSKCLDDISTFFKEKLQQENLIGNFSQVRIEKNSLISKEVFTKQLELKKQITKEEKVYERVFNEWSRMKKSELMIKKKIDEFSNVLNIPIRSMDDIYKSMGSFEKYTGYGKKLLKVICDEYEKKEEEEKINMKKIREEESKAKPDFLQRLEDIFKLNNGLKIEDAKMKVSETQTDSTKEILSNQQKIIGFLTEKNSKLSTKSNDIAAKTEEARTFYQTKSTTLSSQLETLGALDGKIKAISSVVNNKEKLLKLKTKALEYEIDQSEIDKTLQNINTYNVRKYCNLSKQKSFLEVYEKSMQNLTKKQEALSNNNGNGNTSRRGEKVKRKYSR